MLNIDNQAEPTPKRWIVWFSIGLIILTSLPYLYAWIITPEDNFFTGGHTLAPGDLPVYFSYIEQARDGQIFFKDLFTSEEHSPFIFSPPWLIIGQLANWFGVSTVLAFHLARVLLIPIFIIVVHLWLRLFFRKWSNRKLGLWLVVFGSGFGWLVGPILYLIYDKDFLINLWPMDLWVTEAFGFLTMYQTPHFLASTSLILLCLYWYLLGVINIRYKYFILSGLTLLALMSFHPFHLPTIAVVMGLFILFQWIKVRRFPLLAVKGAMIVAGLALPMILYQVLLIWINPIAAERASQNINATPAWWSVLLSYGALIPLALIGLKLAVKRLDTKWSFMIIWIIGQYLVFTVPSPFNRRLTQFWLLPLIILAVVGWAVISRKLKNKKWLPPRPALGFLFIIMFALSPIVVVSKDIIHWRTERLRTYPHHFYLPNSYEQAGQWLKQNSKSDSIIISNGVGGLYLPSLADRQVVIGHGVETLGFHNKWESLQEILIKKDSRGLASLAKSWGADYILVDARDELWKDFDIDEAIFKTVWQSAPLTLYKVN